MNTRNEELPLDEVQVWSASLTIPEQVVIALNDLLSPDELERAARFVFAADRKRFVVGRAILRIVLAKYVKQQARDIQFKYGPDGKPQISTGSCEAGLEFNVSHAHELMLYAVTYRRLVGVDVEYIRPIADLAQVAATAFSQVEQSELAALNKDDQLLGFFHGWTRKEAYLKASGDGLLMPLDAFDVALTPGERPLLLANRIEPDEIHRWSFFELMPADGYIGALVVQGQDARVSQFSFALA